MQQIMSLKYLEPKWHKTHGKEGMRHASWNQKPHRNLFHLALRKLKLHGLGKNFGYCGKSHISPS